MTRTSIILRIAFAIVLFVVAFFLYRPFASWFLIDKQGVTYFSDSLTTIRKHALLFSACFAFVSLGSILLNLRRAKNILIASLTLLLCTIAGIAIKRSVLAVNIKYIFAEEKAGDGINEYQFSIEAVLPEVYMFVSLIIGLTLLLIVKRIGILFRGDSDESNKNLVSQLLSKQ